MQGLKKLCIPLLMQHSDNLLKSEEFKRLPNNVKRGLLSLLSDFTEFNLASMFHQMKFQI